MKISVIVPVYKAEKYIVECINSILSQTYTDFELILIDDGSPDLSGKICDEYASNDERIIVVHKSNGGVSSARNVGISRATGEWITFVDADDMLFNTCLEVCINKIIKDDLDMLQFFHTSSKVYTENEYGKVFSSTSFLNLKHNVCIGACFIKADVIKYNHITFPEEIKLAEDQVFVIKCILNSTRVEIVKDTLYYYRENAMSATATSNINDMLESCRYLSVFKSEYTKSTHQVDNTILSFIYVILRRNQLDRKRIVSLYKSANIKYCDRTSRGCRLLYYLSLFNVRFAFLVVDMLNKVRKWIS